MLQRAWRVEPTGEVAYELARLRLSATRVTEAIPLLEQATALSPTHVAAWYQLSLAYGLTRNLERARATALQAARPTGLSGPAGVDGNDRCKTVV